MQYKIWCTSCDLRREEIVEDIDELLTLNEMHRETNGTSHFVEFEMV